MYKNWKGKFQGSGKLRKGAENRVKAEGKDKKTYIDIYEGREKCNGSSNSNTVE